MSNIKIAPRIEHEIRRKLAVNSQFAAEREKKRLAPGVKSRLL